MGTDDKDRPKVGDLHRVKHGPLDGYICSHFRLADKADIYVHNDEHIVVLEIDTARIGWHVAKVLHVSSQRTYWMPEAWLGVYTRKC